MKSNLFNIYKRIFGLSVFLIFFIFSQDLAAQVFLDITNRGAGTGVNWNNAKSFSSYFGSLSSGTIPANTKVYIKANTGYTYLGGSSAPVIRVSPGVLIQGGFPVTATGNDLSGYNPVINTTRITITGGTAYQLFGQTNMAGTESAEIKGLDITASSTTCAWVYVTGNNGFSAGGGGTINFTDLYVHDMCAIAFDFLTTVAGSKAVFNNCLLKNLSTGSFASAIYANTNTTSISFNNSSVVGCSNTSSVGSGGGITTMGDFTATNSSFCGNTSQWGGGAIQIGYSSYFAKANFTGCTFSNNTVTSVGFGGAILNSNGYVTLNNCNFYGNKAYGGGAYGSSSGVGNTLTVNNCVFYNNGSPYTLDVSNANIQGGGAIYTYPNSGLTSISNSKFVSNYTNGSLGGAIFMVNSGGTTSAASTVTGCLFYGNNVGGNTTSGPACFPAGNGNTAADIALYSGSQFGTHGTLTLTNNQLQLSGINSYLSHEFFPRTTAPVNTNYINGGGNTFGNTNNGGVVSPSFNCPATITIPCLASDDPSPALSTYSISNTCPAATVNLTTITAGNQNADVALTWHTGSTATDANKVTTPGAINQGGIYYAAFYDAANGCYSTTSAPVTVSINGCTVISNICPAVTVNLTALVQSGNLPVTWHTGTPATDSNKIASPDAVSVSGTYYAAFYDAAGGCYSPTVSVPVQIITCPSYCTQPAAIGTPDYSYSLIGISTYLTKSSDFPDAVSNGFIALESKDKGFVITRVANENAIVNPKEGMIIYDIAANCVKLYNGTVWNCIVRSCNN
ncbi:MAG: right-handed parallel beta-helix repeat-containing protein [Chlorobi bacterium]|nr:right-handed parallel beta-helix repeat-containing protein [Chlorobiota bacterium]